ncbi:EamA-like transporter family protein [Phycisphaerae bacterium RAS1]|nr:EamA-like transporter family protein [Phycisphaerae bacterium RAS1]
MIGPDPVLIGQAAGVATSALWTGTSLLFTAAGRRLGATTVNAVRLVVALLLHALTQRIWSGQWIPPASGGQVAFLAVSGVLGLCLGDQAIITAMLAIGPRLTSLIQTTAPIVAALLGAVVLDEILPPSAWIGIGMTIAGVVWVLLERGESASVIPSQRWRLGVTMALIAAACQAGGLLLSKQGIGHGWLPPEQRLNPQAAALLRMAAALAGMIPLLALRSLRAQPGAARPTAAARRQGYALSICGAVVGPYLGVWFSLVASDRVPLGVAQTLCSLTPIFILPVLALGYREKISFRAGGGAVVAVAGVAVLFLRPFG